MSGFHVVAVLDIAEHPRNVRRDVGDLSELVASIRSHGILQPLTVAPDTDPEKAKWVLVAGHRRLRAARQAGLSEVPVVVRDDLTTLADQVAAMIGENVHRCDLSPVEESDAYQLLLDDAGLKVPDIARVTGRPQTTVRSRLRLQSLPAAASVQLHRGQMTLADAEALADLAEVDADAAREVAEAPGTDLRWEVQRRRQAIARARARSARLKALWDAGWRVLTATPDRWSLIGTGDVPKGWTPYDSTPPVRLVHSRAWPIEVRLAHCDETEVAGWNEETRALLPTVQACPDRVAVLMDWSGMVSDLATGYCMRPDQHPQVASEGVGADGGDSAASEVQAVNDRVVATRQADDEERRQRRQWQADRDTAAAVRRHWLHDLLTEGGIAPSNLRRSWARWAVAVIRLALELPFLTVSADVGEIDEWLRGLPGFPPPMTDEDDPELDDDPFFGSVREALSRRSLETEALCLVMAQVESDLPEFSHYLEARLWAAYWEALAAVGYDLTEWESRELQACVSAIEFAARPTRRSARHHDGAGDGEDLDVDDEPDEDTDDDVDDTDDDLDDDLDDEDPHLWDPRDLRDPDGGSR